MPNAIVNMKKRLRAAPQDIYYYRPLHIWAKCLGILPNFDVHNLHVHERPYWNGFLMAIVFTTIYIYETYGKLHFMLGALQPSIFVTDIGGDVSLFVANVTSIIRLSLVKAKSVCRFLDNLKRIDAELRKINVDIQYPRRVFVVEFVLANILFVIYYIYDAYIWVGALTWDTYRWYFLRDMQCFHVVVLSLVIRNYSLAIRNRINILNDLLQQVHPANDSMVAFVIDRNQSSNKTITNRILKEQWHVQKMRRIFAHICRTVELFNDIFGWIYLVLYVSIVMYILTSSNIALVYGIGNKKIGAADFGWALVILCVIWALLPMIIGFFIFSSADKCAYEFKRTPIICYSVIEGLTGIDQHNILIPELEKFAQQVANSYTDITAAGFFAVNYSIFFALIGSLSSYLIVLIQFM